jgi:lipoate-protein ligase A
MALDELLLDIVAFTGAPVLRFYAWTEPAASFGYFQHFAEIEGMTALRPLVRRPTGGGLVPHDADWTYSLAFPATHGWYSLKARESYERAHLWVRAAFSRAGLDTRLSPAAGRDLPGQCFAGAEQFDVLWNDRKIAGAAQRRTRQGLLIQGSIQPPGDAVSRATWQQAMLDIAREEWNVSWRPLPWTRDWEAEVLALARGKYTTPAYNQRR